MFNRQRDLSDDPDRVIAWRIERLREAGFPTCLADALARDTRYDLHALLDLTDRGCPAELAARILAPFARARVALATSQGRSTDPADGARSAGADRAPTGSSSFSPRTEQKSRVLIERLSAPGAERDAALVDLHVLLSRAARFEMNRRRATSTELCGGDDDDLAHQSADDARVAILRKLGDFRGESRFRTWAYKFALCEAAANVRKRAWQGREIPLKAETWPLIVGDHERTPQQSVETTDTLAALRQAIEGDLSPHQREVLVAIALNGVPIDVLAERLNTTRGALYKTLHDGRGKLRAALLARDLGIHGHEGREPAGSQPPATETA